jgi:hypothetical protein
LDQLLQRLVIQREIRDQPLEPAVLVLELPEPAEVTDLQAAVPRLPTVERLFADSMTPAEVAASRMM